MDAPMIWDKKETIPRLYLLPVWRIISLAIKFLKFHNQEFSDCPDLHFAKMMKLNGNSVSGVCSHW